MIGFLCSLDASESRPLGVEPYSPSNRQLNVHPLAMRATRTQPWPAEVPRGGRPMRIYG